MAAPNPESAAALANLLTKVARYAVVLGAAGSVAQAAMYNGAWERRPRMRKESKSSTWMGSCVDGTTTDQADLQTNERRGTGRVANGTRRIERERKTWILQRDGTMLTLPPTLAFVLAILS
uniref:Uncharacterized protein n=1 Tax=Picocystis salinarum TaxID=88271 RepID=A0A7S3UB08_9CHLO